jgi:hypothetical protein
VTNDIKFTPAALHWGDLIFDAFETDTHKFVIYPFDKYQFSDFLFLKPQFRIANSSREDFSKSKFMYQLAQMLYDKMNLFPNLESFMNEQLPPSFTNLLSCLSYQKNIRSKKLKNLLEFLQKFTKATSETKKSKLRLDLPFEAIPSAIMIYSNIIPSIRSTMYIKIFIQNVPDEILNLFESTHITINFNENRIKVSFQEFDELIHYFYHQFEVLIFERRTLLFYYNTKLFNSSIFEVLYHGIEESLETCLITREAVAQFLPCPTCQVRFSRGDAWMNEIYFGEGESLHTGIQTLNPRIVDNYHA